LQLLDRAVSRKHLRIRFDEATKRYSLEDMASTHGTFLNKRRIAEARALPEGDEILVGQTTLMFTDQDFEDRESALSHYKKFGKRSLPTPLA
jgi:pSer/pThr/pTyr-binding forkhead associated (FHA) protein